MTLDIRTRLADNLASVRARIATAAAKSSRAADDVRLVAVTKYVDTQLAQLLVDLGCHDLGESRPQELWHKAETVVAAGSQSVRWHMIGHLQRNKLARSLPVISLVHSGDSLRLLAAIDSIGREQNRRIATLVEVNVSGDATKHGFTPAELPALGEPLKSLTHVDICGLMAMAGREGDLDSARGEFAELRQLRDQLRSIWPAEVALEELSMGMSGDFDVAIEEGATLVRVGSALFDGLET